MEIILWKNKILLLFFVIFFSCSVKPIKLLYNQLDWLLPQILRSYLSLKYNQKKHAKKQIAEILKWHRSNELPKYAESLRSIIKDIKKERHSEAIKYLDTIIIEYKKEVIIQMIPDISNFLRILNNEQVEQFFNKMDKEDCKYKKNVVELPEKKLRQKKINNMEKQLETWISKLTKDQKKLINIWGNTILPFEKENYILRLDFKSKLKNVIKLRNNHANFSKAFSQLAIDRLYNNWVGLDDKEKFEYNDRLTKNLYLEILKLLTDNQRESLINRLTKLSCDFDKLAEYKN